MRGNLAGVKQCQEGDEVGLDSVSCTRKDTYLDMGEVGLERQGRTISVDVALESSLVTLNGLPRDVDDSSLDRDPGESRGLASVMSPDSKLVLRPSIDSHQ